MGLLTERTCNNCKWGQTQVCPAPDILTQLYCQEIVHKITEPNYLLTKNLELLGNKCNNWIYIFHREINPEN